MEISVFTFLLLVALTNNLGQGLMAEFSQTGNLSIKDQLNKPPIKTFRTEYGETLDCIEIDKQLALDHPLLKNHSIQMKPSNNIQRLGILEGSSRLKAPKHWLKNIRCPKGSVIIKRVEKEDFVMRKFSPLSGMNFEYQEASSQFSDGHQLANLVMPTENVGIHGNINIWGPQVTADQFSSANIFVASQDGSLANVIVAGWTESKKDSRVSTGCFNMLCPGFVQVSQRIPIGLILNPLSTYGGGQFEIALSILQDDATGNWWVQFRGENVGYYPKELFTSLGNGASSGGWGGEIYSSLIEAYPLMGSGHFPEEGFRKACFIRQMKLLSPSYSVIYPEKKKLVENVSMPQCFKVLYAGDFGGETGHTMFFGGPPNCQLWAT